MKEWRPSCQAFLLPSNKIPLTLVRQRSADRIYPRATSVWRVKPANPPTSPVGWPTRHAARTRGHRTIRSKRQWRFDPAICAFRRIGRPGWPWRYSTTPPTSGSGRGHWTNCPTSHVRQKTQRNQAAFKYDRLRMAAAQTARAGALVWKYPAGGQDIIKNRRAFWVPQGDFIVIQARIRV